MLNVVGESAVNTVWLARKDPPGQNKIRKPLEILIVLINEEHKKQGSTLGLPLEPIINCCRYLP